MNKKFILPILASVCVVALCGCDSCSEEGITPAPGTSVREKVVTIADFETWETGMQLIRTGKNFGTIRENTDAKYVKSGAKSAQLHPLGGYTTGTAPIFFFPTVSETMGFDHSDFSDADKVDFAFYNNEEGEIKVAVGLVTSISGLDFFQTTSIEYQSLKTGWNDVTYTVDVSALSINVDITKIQGIYVAFENTKSREEADAPDLYLDDVILTRKDKPDEIKDLVQLKENEFADFESDWQKHVIGVKNTACAPEISIVNADDYKVGEAPAEGTVDDRPTLKSMDGSLVSGNKVLRVLEKTGTQFAASYPGIEFAPALLQRSLFGDLEEEDYGRVTFAFDLYNNSASEQLLGVSFYTANGLQRKEYGVNTKAYSWVSVRIPIKDLYNDFKEANKNSTLLFTSPGRLAIYWAEFTDGDKELFFDNFRYEVEERDMEAKPTITVAPFVRIAEVGDRLELPTVKVTDKYDLNLEAKLSVFEKTGDEWIPVTLVEGLIPITKVGEYKIVASAINSLQNENSVECLFRGAEKVKDNLWASYEYADEVSNICVYGDKTESNQAEWLQAVSIGGETKAGVMKIMTDNADPWGAGYVGFRFPKQRLDDAADANWDYFTISIYIDAPVSQMSFYSWNNELVKNVPTGRWTEIVITKKLLNLQSYINRSTTPLSDSMFYETFGEICGSAMDRLLFTTSVKETASNSKVVYYIDDITWGAYTATNYPDNDDAAVDIYKDEWADPFMNKQNG